MATELGARNLSRTGTHYRFTAVNAERQNKLPGKVELHLVDVTPSPGLTRFNRPHDRMLGRVKMLGCMLIRGRVAAPNMAANLAHS